MIVGPGLRILKRKRGSRSFEGEREGWRVGGVEEKILDWIGTGKGGPNVMVVGH